MDHILAGGVVKQTARVFLGPLPRFCFLSFLLLNNILANHSKCVLGTAEIYFVILYIIHAPKFGFKHDVVSSKTVLYSCCCFRLSAKCIEKCENRE